MTPRIAIFAFALGMSATGCAKPNPRDAARKDLEEILNDSVGKTGNPKVSFVVELKAGPQSHRHMEVEFDTVAFANMSDSAFAVHSRQIASLANRHYTGGPLDSVTVLVHDSIAPGAWRITRMWTYAVGDLFNSPPSR